MAPRRLNKLTARYVQTVCEPGRHSDGGGLYLSVGKGEARRWVFLYSWRGKTVEMGLGSLKAVSLARARQKASEARALLAEGVSPLDAKRAAANVPTFGDFCRSVLSSIETEWRNPKHREQWRSTLETYGAPISTLPVNRIETADVLRVLAPIWQSKPETASRVRGRIERILEAAKARGFRTGENPARWRGHLENLLPKRAKLSRGHHPALPFLEAPKFIAELREREGVAARALEFAILTAARSGEVRGATWRELHRDAQVWEISAQRTKAAREHRVALSPGAITILQRMGLESVGDSDALIFPGNKSGSGLSDSSLSAVLRRMGYPRERASVHGFRSTFRDWVGEATEFPREVAEAALAHVVGDATERAYRRKDALERRRVLMSAWDTYLNGG